MLTMKAGRRERKMIAMNLPTLQSRAALGGSQHAAFGFSKLP